MTNIYDEAVGALARDPEIALLYGALSAGDRATLALLLDHDAAAATTVPGSPNAQFWYCLSEYGWMAEVDPPAPEGPFEILQYRLTDRGYRAIPVLLDRLPLPKPFD